MATNKKKQANKQTVREGLGTKAISYMLLDSRDSISCTFIVGVAHELTSIWHDSRF